jgi:hypothetical protein
MQARAHAQEAHEALAASQSAVADRDGALDALADELVSVSALCDAHTADKLRAEAQVCACVCV